MISIQNSKIEFPLYWIPHWLGGVLSQYNVSSDNYSSDRRTVSAQVLFPRILEIVLKFQNGKRYTRALKQLLDLHVSDSPILAG